MLKSKICYYNSQCRMKGTLITSVTPVNGCPSITQTAHRPQRKELMANYKALIPFEEYDV